MDNNKELKIYALDQLLDLRSKNKTTKTKLSFKPPFIIRTKEYDTYTDWARTKYLVASSNDEAERLFFSRDTVYKNNDEYYFSYFKDKFVVTNNKYEIKEIQISIDSLKELVRAEDFIKYFTYYNMKYQDLF